MDSKISEISEISSHDAVPSRKDLVQRARDMVPTLIERAEKCEAMGCAPKETIDEFKQA